MYLRPTQTYLYARRAALYQTQGTSPLRRLASSRSRRSPDQRGGSDQEAVGRLGGSVGLAALIRASSDQRIVSGQGHRQPGIVAGGGGHSNDKEV
jgi:hypothetical protein